MIPSNNDKPNFLDRGTLTAFALILLFWFGWSKFMEQPQNPTQPVTQDAKVVKPDILPVQSIPGSVLPTESSIPKVVTGEVGPERTLVFEDGDFSFQVSSRGMGISNVNVKKYKTRDNKPIILGAVKGDYPFSTSFLGANNPIDFQVEKTTPNTFVGRASVSGMVIEKTIVVDSAKYTLKTQVKVTGNLEAFKGLTTSLSEETHPEVHTSFLDSSTQEYQDWFVLHENNKTRKIIAPKEGLDFSEQNVSIAALSSHYFTLAVADHSDVLPKFLSKMGPASPVISGKLTYQPLSQSEVFSLNFLSYAGPKSFEILTSADDNLNQVIDYGFFGALGKPILWLLKYLQTIFANWGVSIVVLTIIVRMLVLPFNAYAFRSMKALQRIQPEMNRIKEKYKDKPSEAKLQMNQEIMQLMKANNASPVGGCLPTLLQLPVFFALYQVLGQSIELYKAPFVLWISDLSAKDPYFVLPVLMGVTMYMQQKLTPTTMDPQQAKILQWMPVIFSVFMISLPSGLTLYIFVSTLFGIIQQYYFMRDKSTTAVGRAKEAKA
jgi:YidC/Oxa1 family membrane protein insertase